ncbi:MAG: NAD(P)/FAD-dependent oxidoreductase [Pseudomonadota bacterium]
MSAHFDTVVIGAGAAGMMCAAHAAASGGRVLVVDHAKAPGEKIRISGGGRCNFTNLNAAPENFLSANPHFCKSALSRYTQWDFIELVDRYGIAWHEKTLGQLFCDETAKDVIAMLVSEMEKVSAELWLKTSVDRIEHGGDRFMLQLATGEIACENLVIACGGKSIPKMGATGYGYDIAAQFDIPVTDTRPALVPFTFSEEMLSDTRALSGVSVPAMASCNGAGFDEAVLFTHRGLSGPAALQISSFWRDGDAIRLAFVPELDLLGTLRARRASDGRKALTTVLAEVMPKRLVEYLAAHLELAGNLADQSDKALKFLTDALADWRIRPQGTEGYRTAEVTLGGVVTDALNARTMEVKSVPALYFIGEVVDVTGWLGGYNFQWAWSSGWAAGTAIASK